HPLVVGVGASAGGAEAFLQLLEGLGAEPGFAIVYVPRFLPEEEILAPSRLQQATSLPVIELTGRKKIKPNTVYLATPGHLLELQNGFFRVATASDDDELRRAIDHFFHSIAETLRDRGIGVILSGA